MFGKQRHLGFEKILSNLWRRYSVEMGRLGYCHGMKQLAQCFGEILSAVVLGEGVSVWSTETFWSYTNGSGGGAVLGIFAASI